MILLTSTSDKLQVVSSAAAAIDVHASWVDNTATAVTPGRTNTAITTAATIDVVAAPAASTQRNVKTLHIRNRDATLSSDVTVQHIGGGVTVQLYKITLVAGEAFQYTDDNGFEVPAVALPGAGVTGGNVSNSGTPISGQLAQWLSATTIQGVDASSLGFLTASVAAATYQPLDADLTALAGLTGTNTIYYRSGTNSWSAVTFSGLTFVGGVLTSTATGSGNVSSVPTPTNGQLARWTGPTTIEGINVSSLGFQNFDATLTALAGLDSSAGLVEQTGADSFTKRAIGVGAASSIPTRVDADGRYAAIVHTHAQADVTNLVSDLSAKEGTIAAGTTAQYWRGDKSWQTLDKAAVGLGNVDNTSDASKPISSAVQVQLDLKQPLDADLTTLASLSGTNTIYYRSGASAWSAVTIGANLTFVGGTLAASGGGSPGAPVGAEYITSSADATLTAERVLTDSATVTWDRTVAGQIIANAVGGGGGSGSASGFTAYKTADQTLGNATWTKLVFGSTAYNHGSFFSTGPSTSRYTPPAGETTLIASAFATGLLLGSNLFIAIYKNGTLLHFASSNTTDGFAQIVCSDTASGTDYYEAWINGQTASTFVVPTGNNDGVYFQGFQSIGAPGPQGPAGVDGGISDGDKGDVIVSGSGFTWVIDNNVVTYAKLQDISATARLLARKSAGAGDPEEASLSEVLDFIGSATRGDILFRGASTWSRLGAGTAGSILTTQGTSADPTWGAAPSGSAGKHTLWIPAGAMVSRSTNGAAPGTIETTTNKCMVRSLDFDTATQEFAQFEVAMPKSWDEGTVTFVPVWSHAATTTNFGVVWALQGVARGDAEALDVAFGTEQTSTDTGGTTNFQYTAPESAAITLAGPPVENDVVLFQIKRNPTAAADTLAVDARLHGVKLYYTTNAGTDN